MLAIQSPAKLVTSSTVWFQNRPNCLVASSLGKGRTTTESTEDTEKETKAERDKGGSSQNETGYLAFAEGEVLVPLLWCRTGQIVGKPAFHHTRKNCEQRRGTRTYIIAAGTRICEGPYKSGIPVTVTFFISVSSVFSVVVLKRHLTTCELLGYVYCRNQTVELEGGQL